MSAQEWSEERIASALAMFTFRRSALVMVPNTYWTGHETDLLVVRKDLRLIDIEVKISCHDFRQDKFKDKWLVPSDYTGCSRWPAAGLVYGINEPKWPRRIWKHYYALPEIVWKNELLTHIPVTSGILWMRKRTDGSVGIHVHRNAKPNKKADRVTLEEVIDIARACSLRYWDLKARHGEWA